MSGLVDQFGNPIGKATRAQLSEAANVYEGVLNIELFDDAVEAKGTCAHCFGAIEGVLRFPPGYKLRGDPDRERDAAQQVAAKVKREHFCISRVQADKLPVSEFLKRFN